MLKKYQVLLLILLSYIVLFAFYPAITSDFINLDDVIMVTENQIIRNLSLSNIKEMFCSFHYKLYHPIVNLSYAIEYHFCGLNPYLYHVNNILLHILNVLILFFIIKKLFKSFFVAYVVAILFAIHPVNVEVVSWVTSRKDTLYSFFFLLSILFYIKIDDSKYKKLLFFSSIISFILSCLSKPMAVTLPLVLILIDFYNEKLDLRSIKKYIPFFVISAIFVFLAIFAHYSPEEKVATTMLTRAVNFMDAQFNYLFYICKFVFPVNLSCLYPAFYNHRYCMVPNFIFYSATMLYLLILLSVLSLRINKKIFFGFIFFIITLLPASGLMPTGVAPVADRYVYISYIGLSLILAEFLFYIYNKGKLLKYISLIFVCIITITLFYMTYQRTVLWSDNEKLMTDAINYSPATAEHAYILRGTLYKAQGKLEKAQKDLQKAYSINSNNGYTVFHLAHLRQLQKKYKEAKNLYACIRKGDVNYAYVVNNMAIILDEENKTDKAIELMQNLIDEKNIYVTDSFYHTLAIFYLKEKNTEPALKNFKLATKINPSNYIYYLEQMDIYLKENNFSEFENIALTGLKNTKNNMSILNELSKEYFLRKDYENAEKYLLKSVILYPNNHFAYFLLGNILAIKSDYKNAIVFYTTAILLSKENGEYYFKRAAAYLMLNKYELAKKDVEKAEQKGFKIDGDFKKDLEKIKKRDKKK